MSQAMYFDIDGWLTEPVKLGDHNYPNREPRLDRINFLKKLSGSGVSIVLESCRFPEDRQCTTEWLKRYGVPFDALKLLGRDCMDKKHPDVWDDANLEYYYTSEGVSPMEVDFASNSLINAAIASSREAGTISGSKGQTSLQLERTFRSDVNYFFSFLLSDDKVNKEIDVEIESGTTSMGYIPKSVPFETCVCFSGGIDSLCALSLYDPLNSLPLYIGYNEIYNDLEWNFAKKFEAVRFDVPIGGRDPSWEYIVPMRNFIFVAIAALFSNNIVLAVTEGDRSPDKSRKFFYQSSQILSEFYGREIKVYSPFMDKTKTQIVKDYLDSGYNARCLEDAVTCYSNGTEGKLCGACGACFRRAVAFKINGIHNVSDYEVDPLDSRSSMVQGYLRRIDEGKYPDGRVGEILEAITDAP